MIEAVFRGLAALVLYVTSKAAWVHGPTEDLETNRAILRLWHNAFLGAREYGWRSKSEMERRALEAQEASA